MDPLNRNSSARIQIRRHVLSEGTKKQEDQEAGKGGFLVSTALGLIIMVTFGVVLVVSFLVLRIYCLSSEEEEEEEAKPQDQAKDELGSFPVFSFGSTAQPPSSSPPDSGSSSSFEGTCAICLDDYVLGDCIMVLPRCKHMFHKDCVEQSLFSHSLRCPICRICSMERNQASTSRNCQNAPVVSPSSLSLNLQLG